MIFNKYKLGIFSVATALLIGFVFFSIENKRDQVLDENKMKDAYNSYLSLEVKNAQQTFGQMAKNNNAIQLQSFSLKECIESEKSYECTVNVILKNFRGDVKEKEKISVEINGAEYTIKNVIKIG